MPIKRFRKGTYNKYFKRKTRGKRTRRTTKSFQSRVGKVLMNKAETKYYDRGVEDVQLYHNLGRGTLIAPSVVSSIPQFFNVWADIQQGTSRFQRIGDEIMPRGIKLNMWIANKADRPNTAYRVIVAVLPKTFGGLVVDFAFDPLQQPNSGSLGHTNLFPADKDKGVKFLYDKIHRVQQFQRTGGDLKEMTKYLHLWIKPKRGTKIRFDTTSSTIVNKPIAVYVIPYEQYSTLTTSICASCAGFMRLYYKDV